MPKGFFYDIMGKIGHRLIADLLQHFDESQSEDNSMKILLCSEWYQPIINGVVTSMVNLRNELMLFGHDVRVLTISRTKESYEENGVYHMGSRSFEWIYPNVRLSFFSEKKVINTLADWCPDVIHTQTEFSSFHFARKIARQTKSVLVHTYHTVYEDYTHYFAPNRALGRLAVKHFTRNILGKVDGIIVPTVKVEHLLRKYGIDRKVCVIPTGLDLSKFSQQISREERKEMRTRLGISEMEPIAVYVGRMAEEKNLEEILFYLSGMTDIKLLLVGDGPYMNRLIQIVKDRNLNDRVIFTGMVPPTEVASYYQLGDLFVCASNSETQGLTYIEAMASGLPILVKADECLEGVVVEDQNGWMYHEGEGFKQKISEIFTDSTRRSKMAVYARNFAHENFSSRKFAEKVESVYYEVVDAKTKK